MIKKNINKKNKIMGNKKILAIIGSPKKNGQTIDQVRIFEKILKEKSSIDFEYLYLKDFVVKECLGCNVCFDKGEKFCPLKDDRDKIIEKIELSDGIIWVSPIYSMHISYLLKKLMDRFAFLHHRPKFFNKKGFIIIVKGNSNINSIKYMKINLISWGFDYTGFLGMPSLIIMPEKMKEKKIKKVKMLGNNFLKQIENNKISNPNILQLLLFKMWKMRAKMQEETNADYKFFKENNLFNKKYFYPVKIFFIKRIISFLLFKLVVLQHLKHELGDLKKGL
jgi:multimeric flavodoxin WrbA